MKQIGKRFREAASEFPRQFLISMSLAMLLALLNALVPFGLRLYVQEAAQEADVTVLAVGLLLFLLYFAIKIFLNVLWYVSLDHFGGKYMEKLLLLMEKRLAETSYAEVERLSPGVIRNILYTDVLQVFSSVGHHIPALAGALAVMALTVFLSFLYERKVTLLICVSIGLGALLSWAGRKALARTAGKTNAMLKKQDQWCTQFVDMLPVIQRNPLLSYYQERTSKNLENFVAAAAQEDARTMFWNGMVSGYNSLFSVFLSVLLALPAAGHSISNFVFFTMIANLMLEQSQMAEQLFLQIAKAQISFHHVDTVCGLSAMCGERTLGEIREVCFREVSFSYTAGSSALFEVSCQLRKGDAVLLEGGNGSRKTSFLKLLSGLYLPSRGEVLINGVSLSQYKREEINRKILYVSQEEKLINETFREYLTWVTEKKIGEDSYEELAEFLKLPVDGRRIEGNGALLSVGQRKKLLAMKLFLRFDEAEVILVDELTAGLDAQTAKKVYERLFDLQEKQKKILVLTDHIPPEGLPLTHIYSFREGKLEKCKDLVHDKASSDE